MVNRIDEAVCSFLNSKAFLYIVTAIACLTVSLSIEQYVIPLFVLLLLFVILADKNFLNLFLPMILLNGFALRTGAQTTYLMRHVWLVIPVVIAVVLHFVIHLRRPVFLGKLFFSHIAVSVALLLGGLGSITAAEYFDPAASLYYVLLLGPGMLLFYFWFRNHTGSNEYYDCRDRLMLILYLIGVFCAYSIIEQSCRSLYAFGGLYGTFWGNDICEIMIFAIPAPFYFAIKDYRHMPVGVFFGLLMLPTFSLSGIFVGACVTAFSMIALAVLRRDKRRFTLLFLGLVLLLSLGCIVVLSLLHKLPYESLADFFIAEENGRLALLREGWEDFLSNPVFGVGIGAKRDGAEMAFMTMSWAHNYIFEVLGSMGLVGVICYGYHLTLRTRLFLGKRQPFYAFAGLSLLGIFLISMLQPGEFCPMPYETMAVMLCAVAEVATEEEKRKKLAHPLLTNPL